MKKFIVKGWIILISFIALFVLIGVLIGRATVSQDITPEKCTPICIEQYEDYAC